MRTVTILILLCAFGGGAPAQHAKSEKGGLYTFSYKGDTWTGEIAAIDQETRQITLQYADKKGQVEKFDAKLLPNFKVSVKDHPEQKVSSLNIGDKITLYYIAAGQKYPVTDNQGKKKEIVATENLVFEGELYPPKKQQK